MPPLPEAGDDGVIWADDYQPDRAYWEEVLDRAPYFVICRFHTATRPGLPCNFCGWEPGPTNQTWLEINETTFMLMQPSAVSFIMRSPTNHEQTHRFTLNPNDPRTGRFC